MPATRAAERRASQGRDLAVRNHTTDTTVTARGQTNVLVILKRTILDFSVRMGCAAVVGPAVRRATPASLKTVRRAGRFVATSTAIKPRCQKTRNSCPAPVTFLIRKSV